MPLRQEHLVILRAAVDRIIPADDYPSASQAGVLEFLTALIESEGLVDRYEAGISGLGIDFAELNEANQDQLLKQLPDQTFLELLIRQTMEGYYSNSGKGSNHDGVAWKMLGFEVTA